MYKIKITHRFNAPLDKVQDARERRFENPEKFPELKGIKETYRKEDGRILKTKRNIELSAQIPKALRNVLKPEMLKCVDVSTYDLETGVHTWTVIPVQHKNVFKCKGKSIYKERSKPDGGVETVRDLEMTFEVKVPVVGKLAEQVLGKAYEKSLDKDRKSIKKMLNIMDEEDEDEED